MCLHVTAHKLTLDGLLSDAAWWIQTGTLVESFKPKSVLAMSHDAKVDPMAPGDKLERKQNKFVTVNRSAMQQYKISLDRLSNASSNLILEEMWNEHADIIDDQSPEGIDNLAGPIGMLIPNKYMIRNSKTWKSDCGSILDETEIKKCLEKTECSTCNGKIENFHIFKSNKPKSNPNVFEYKESKPVFKSVATDSGSKNTQLIQVPECKNKSMYSAPYPSKTLEEMKTLVPTKYTGISNQNNASCLNGNIQNTNKEKCNFQPVKSVFKTARDQLIASNPAAKRSLGTARKPQNKFVSPMMTENREETENESDDHLKHIDPKMVELIQSEIIDNGAPIAWEDIAGLKTAKSVIQEAVVWPLLRPDIFTGLRRPPKGVLLFGPPGTGKTLIGKCVASQCRATFFNISASSLTSKWIGDGEKMVRALFAVAKCHQPAVIFIDEIDSLLTQRSDAEHEATRRIKTEFLVQFDGAGTGEEDRILIIGATNRPQELDEAARRRLVKRLYIPLPDFEARKQIVMNLMRNERNELQPADVEEVCRLSEGYSGADMRSLCSEAAMGPIRSVPLSQIVNIQSSQVRPVSVEDFRNGLQRVRPSVSPDDLTHYVKWNATYGLGC